MGNVCGSTGANAPVKASALDEARALVGTTARFNPLINVQEVQPDRRSMAALEVLSEIETIYRRQDKTFPRNGDLDYSSDAGLQFLRMVLDEPVGRYYLLEFCEKKTEFKPLTNMIRLWEAIYLLDHAELMLKDALQLQQLEQQALKNQAESQENSHKSKRKTRATNMVNILRKEIPVTETDSVNSLEMSSKNVKSTNFVQSIFSVNKYQDEEYAAVADKNIKLASGIKMRDSDDVEGVLNDAQSIIDFYLTDDAPRKVQFEKEEYNNLVEVTRKNVLKLISSEKVHEIRTSAFIELQNACIKTMTDKELPTHFKLHSEYKRYLKKFAKVYNFISHKDFDFMQILGKGSFGRVIRVRKKTTQKNYALKVMSKKKILSGAESREQVTIEREVLVLCFCCKFIVKLHFAFQTTRALFIALDLLEGGTLLDIMDRRTSSSSKRSMTIQEVRVIAAHIILGLNHLHLHGILYRDLKPVNVMLNSKGNAVLTDMGLCAKYKKSIFEIMNRNNYKSQNKLSVAVTRTPGSGVLTTGDTVSEGALSAKSNNDAVFDDKLVPLHDVDYDTICKLYLDPTVKSMSILEKHELKCVGTPSFRAPEILAVSSSKDKGKNSRNFRRNGYGHEVDYWALGVTIHYLLTGSYPFKNRAFGLFGPTTDLKQNEIKQQKNLPTFASEIQGDDHLISLLSGLLEKEPKDRLGHDIKQLQQHPFFTAFDYDTQSYKVGDASTQTTSAAELWRRIYNGDIKPVYRPKIKKDSKDEIPKYTGLSDAMKHFQQQEVLDLFVNPENEGPGEYPHVRSKYQKLFDEWDYIPERLLKDEWESVEKIMDE